jgi:hypothetical protein
MGAMLVCVWRSALTPCVLHYSPQEAKRRQRNRSRMRVRPGPGVRPLPRPCIHALRLQACAHEHA